MNRLSYLLALLTIAAARLTLYTLESRHIYKFVYLGGLRWHHLYTGAILVIIGLLLPRQRRVRAIIFGVGAGLLIDESFLPLVFYGLHQFTYWYWGSVLIVLFFLAGLLWMGAKMQKNRG